MWLCSVKWYIMLNSVSEVRTEYKYIGFCTTYGHTVHVTVVLTSKTLFNWIHYRTEQSNTVYVAVVLTSRTLCKKFQNST